MKMSSAFPSKYLKAADLGDNQVRVSISHIEMEDVGDTDKKPVMYFINKTKGLVLNKTNSKAIVAVYGDDTENWNERPIILYSTTVDFRGDMVEAIRVRVPKAEPKHSPSKIETGIPPRSENPIEDIGDPDEILF